MSYKGLQRLNGTLRALADVPSQASRDAADRIADLIEESFDAGLDPYGRAWAPLMASTIERHPGRGAPPLTDTGAMRGSVHVTPKAGAGIDITIDAPYAKFHQTGTKYMAQRQIIPQSGGIAPAWREAIAEAVADNIKKALE